MKDFDDLYRDMNSVVNLYTSQFKRKKAAWGLHNSKLKQKGSIDMCRIYSYKTSDNIFQKKVKQPKEKSHGIILLIDNSYSMVSNIFSVVQKATELAIFAVRNKIDMECYFFTSGRNKCAEKDKEGLNVDDLKLVNLYNRNMSETDIRNIFYNYYLFKYNRNMLDTNILRHLEHIWYMSGTPLLEAYMAMVERCKLMSLRDIQHINLCVLTDGETNSPLYFGGDILKSFLDPFSQNIYNVDNSLKMNIENKQLELMNRILKDSNITTSHIHITSEYSFYDKIIPDTILRDKFNIDSYVYIDNNPLKFDNTLIIKSKYIKNINLDTNDMQDYNHKIKINKQLTTSIIDALCQYYL